MTWMVIQREEGGGDDKAKFASSSSSLSDSLFLPPGKKETNVEHLK